MEQDHALTVLFELTTVGLQRRQEEHAEVVAVGPLLSSMAEAVPRTTDPVAVADHWTITADCSNHWRSGWVVAAVETAFDSKQATTDETSHRTSATAAQVEVHSVMEAEWQDHVVLAVWEMREDQEWAADCEYSCPSTVSLDENPTIENWVARMAAVPVVRHSRRRLPEVTSAASKAA